ncbi:MAG: permease [Bacteroidaceae bacterium]|nr:permease [Bacteroidaceae bacterium]
MIQRFADWLVYGIFGLDAATPLGMSVNFFFYDSIKIMVLLFSISFLMGVINAYFPIERLRQYLASHKLYGLDYFLAALFGGITPFCSCSSVPLFIGFVKGGIPLGVTLTFLIASPLVSEVAVAMFLGTFGVKVTLVYIVSGTLLSMVAGYILSRMHLEPYLSDWVKATQVQSTEQSGKWEAESTPFIKRLPVIIRESWGIVRGVLLYILVGIGMGAAMHGYVPEGFFEQYLSAEHWWGVPLAVVLAVPMYANAAGIVPIVEVFVAKGIPLGTAIAFMMAIIGLSLPEATMLKKVMTWRLISIFFGVVTLLIIISGYLFNWLYI